MGATELMSEIQYPSIDENLSRFIKTISNLQTENFLDGEILIVLENKILLHDASKDIASFKQPIFMIGSISKQFFAVALLKALYESSLGTIEDKIKSVKTKLHAPLVSYLLETSPIWAGNMPFWAHNVSLYHLLTHTSGIPNFTGLEEYRAEFFETPHSSTDMMQLVLNKELLFTPGEKFSYSNTGYLLINEVLEKITNKKASRYLKELLFDPIGLLSTANIDKGQYDALKLNSTYLELVPQWKYDPKNDISHLYAPKHSEDMSIAQGGGSIISTAQDLLRWNQALYKERLIFSDPLHDIFMTETVYESAEGSRYGYGIGSKNTKLGMMFGHDGEIGTHRSFIRYFPNHDLSIIFLSYISYDFDKVKEEFKELLASLDTISDNEQKKEEALKIISKKYPAHRGYEKVMSALDDLISDH